MNVTNKQMSTIDRIEQLNKLKCSHPLSEKYSEPGFVILPTGNLRLVELQFFPSGVSESPGREPSLLLLPVSPPSLPDIG